MSRSFARGVVRTFTTIAVLLVTGGLPAGIAAIAQETAAEDKVVLTVGTTEDMVTDNPWFACCAEYEMLNMTYDKLLEFNTDDMTASPGLAEECTPSADYMTWTCNLRSGLKWSDGTPLTSSDVAFTFRFIVDNEIPQYKGYFPFSPTFETPNDTTLIWKAEEPTFAPLVPPWVYIVPEKVWAQYDGEDKKTIKAVGNTPTIGSGPFTLEEWVGGQYWRMERNPYYWGEEPVVDEVVFKIYSSQEGMAQALKNGEIDIANDIIPSLREPLEESPDIKVHVTLSDWWLNLAFNFGGQGPDATNLPALQDITVREAIAHAINKQALADSVYLGTAEPGDTVIRPASTFWHLDIPPEEEFAFDPDLARQMLEDAGYTDTDDDGLREDPNSGEPLLLEIGASEETTGAVDAGKLIKGWLEDVGIGVELKALSEGGMYDIWGNGDFDAYIWYWYGDPDPNYQLSVFASDQCGGWSDGCFADPEFDALYEAQQRELNVDERLKIVQDAQRRLYKQLPGLVLAYPGGVQAYRTDRFEGWVPAPGPNGYLVFGYGSWSYVNIRPVTEGGGTPTGAGTSGISPLVWIAIAVGVIIVLVLTLTRRGRDEA